MLRMNEAPVIETHILNGGGRVGGAGEPGTPAIAPALANAVFDATGHRIRELPLKNYRFEAVDRECGRKCRHDPAETSLAESSHAKGCLILCAAPVPWQVRRERHADEKLSRRSSSRHGQQRLAACRRRYSSRTPCFTATESRAMTKSFSAALPRAEYVDVDVCAKRPVCSNASGTWRFWSTIDLATVWTPYDFYLNGEFSHCGRNSFSLIRDDDGWRIASVTYSMLRESCESSPLGPPPGD